MALGGARAPYVPRISIISQRAVTPPARRKSRGSVTRPTTSLRGHASTLLGGPERWVDEVASLAEYLRRSFRAFGKLRVSETLRHI